ncbi:hypothetical protein H632_c4469p0, partial [Helicosporidium sp. ATCC 50920]
DLHGVCKLQDIILGDSVVLDALQSLQTAQRPTAAEYERSARIVQSGATVLAAIYVGTAGAAAEPLRGVLDAAASALERQSAAQLFLALCTLLRVAELSHHAETPGKGPSGEMEAFS